MKAMKFFAAIPLLLLGYNFVNAQTAGTEFGIKAGVNYGTLPSSQTALTKEIGKMGFTIGAFARIGNDLYFQPEANYSTFGSEFTLSSKKYQPKFKQINIPLMMGYKIVNTENMNLRISLGPDLAYTLNKPTNPEANEYKRFNAGGVINAGVDLGIFTVDLRYNRGLTKINENLEQKSGIFNLSLGYVLK